MPRIKLFLMRHSKSCCNHIRHDSNVQNIPLSQEIRDPALSVDGHRVAGLYGPRIRSCLQKAGFDVAGAMIASSKLHRAQETAKLVFGRAATPLTHFAENGAIPENTPADSSYEKPNWPAVVRQLARLTGEGDSVAVVGHGSYLGSLWPILTGKERDSRLNNLDGILLDISVAASGHFVVHGHRELRCLLKAKDHGDKCTTMDTRKIAALSKMTTFKAKKTKRTMRRSRSQRGGFANLPLGYVQPGGQMAGTSPSPTGVQPVFPTEGQYIRAPLPGQIGGFSPSVMGAFAANGMRLVPMAGYMGYRMYSNEKKKRRTHKRK